MSQLRSLRRQRSKTRKIQLKNGVPLRRPGAYPTRGGLAAVSRYFREAVDGSGEEMIGVCKAT
jgi:hypothetical protein